MLSLVLCLLLAFATEQVVQSYNVAYQDNDQSPLSSELIEALDLREELHLAPFQNLSQSRESELQRLLLNGTYDYCLLIPEGFGDKLREGRFAGILKVYRLDDSSAKSWVDEQLSLSLFDLWCTNYTERLLSEHGLDFSRAELEKERRLLGARTLVSLHEFGSDFEKPYNEQQGRFSVAALSAFIWFFMLLLLTLRWSQHLQDVYASDVQQRLKFHGCSSIAYYLTEFSVLFSRLLFLSVCFFVLAFLLPFAAERFFPGRIIDINIIKTLFNQALHPSLLYLLALIPLFFTSLIKERQVSAMLRMLTLALAALAYVLW